MKTVMILVNGFGVETKNSYSIYSKELMPNIDNLTKTYLFEPIKTNVSNIYDGYRNFSLNIGEMYNYSIFEQNNVDNKMLSNEVYLNLKNEFNTRKTKLHVFLFVDNSFKIVEQVKTLLKDINIDKNKKLYIHIVLTSNNFNDCNEISSILSSLSVELEDYAKIGLVFGLSNILNSVSVVDMNYFFKILISEVAEKWQAFTQKFEVSKGLKQSPNTMKPFVVNSGFSIEKDDLFLFWNYDKVDLTNFITTLYNLKYGEEGNTFKYYSLFELNNSNIPSMLRYQVAHNCLANHMKTINTKALILAKKDNVPVLNYYINGLQSISSPNIEFIEADNYLFKPTELLNIINSTQDELIIINYSIEGTKNIEELTSLLHNIDIMVGNIYENSKGSKYSLIISSLYGFNVVLQNQKGEICNVDFTGKVPLIFIDDFITKRNYLIESGTINDLSNVCYKNIKRDYNVHSIVTKKNALYKLFFNN